MEQPLAGDVTRRRGGWVSAVEKLASAGSVLAIVLVFFNYLAAYLCFFGAECTADEQQITTYRRLAVLTALLVLVTISAAVHNQRRWAFLWHAFVAVTAVTALVVFAVPHLRWDHSGPLPQVGVFENGEQCYTGGTGFCQGG